MKSEKRKIGDIGEEISIRFLEKKGYVFIEKNYLKKIGEIDLVMKKDGNIFFIEVKTGKIGSKFSPEENLTKEKIKKFETIGEFYIKEKKIKNIKYFFYAIFVYLDGEKKKASVKLIKEIY
jgi:putative endonuclease